MVQKEKKTYFNRWCNGWSKSIKRDDVIAANRGIMPDLRNQAQYSKLVKSATSEYLTTH